MRGQDDALLAEAEGERRAHTRLVRAAVLWVPPAVVLVGALLILGAYGLATRALRKHPPAR